MTKNSDASTKNISSSLNDQSFAFEPHVGLVSGTPMRKYLDGKGLLSDTFREVRLSPFLVGPLKPWPL